MGFGLQAAEVASVAQSAVSLARYVSAQSRLAANREPRQERRYVAMTLVGAAQTHGRTVAHDEMFACSSQTRRPL